MGHMGPHMKTQLLPVQSTELYPLNHAAEQTGTVCGRECPWCKVGMPEFGQADW